MTDGRRWRPLRAGWGYGYVGRIEPLGPQAYVHHTARLNDQITEDGGRTWHSGLPAESASFASWVDARVGWAFERHHGDVFRTVDGGRSWRRVAPGLWPMRTSFCDPRVGFGVGEPWLTGPEHGRTVYATLDGGRRWVVRSRLPRARVDDVVCVGPRDVFVVTYPPPSGWFGLLRSRDGGRRWTSVRLPNEATIPSFVSANVFVSAGDGATLRATVDGGRTWRRLKLGADSISSFAFRSSRVGFAVVSPKLTMKGRPPERLLRTTDGGRSWRRVPLRIAGFRAVDLFAADHRFWLFGVRCRTAGSRCRPLLFRTDDDGRHWAAIEHRGEPPSGARFSSPTVGVVAYVRRLLVTHDGGVTWRWERRGGF